MFTSQSLDYELGQCLAKLVCRTQQSISKCNINASLLLHQISMLRSQIIPFIQLSQIRQSHELCHPGSTIIQIEAIFIDTLITILHNMKYFAAPKACHFQFWTYHWHLILAVYHGIYFYTQTCFDSRALNSLIL